jgi:multimeric flavodoxin WrbA
MRAVLVVGIMGSPRRNGNTERLLESSLRGAQDAGAEVVRVRLQELDLSPCDACGRCEKEGACQMNDDMEFLYDLFDRMDIVLLASPIYFSGLTAQTKTMIDRCHCLWVAKSEGRGIGAGRKRVGAFLSAGADRWPRFDNAIFQVKAFFNTIGVEYSGEITVPAVDRPGDIADYHEALLAAETLGRRLVGLLKGGPA